MGNAPLGTTFDPKQAKAIFAEIDADGNGVLTHEELKEGVSRLGLVDDWPANKLLRFISKFDINDDGELDFKEFTKLCKSICKKNRKREAAVAEETAAVVAAEAAAAEAVAAEVAVAAATADGADGFAGDEGEGDRPTSTYEGFGDDAPEDTGADEVYEPIDNSGDPPLAEGEQVFAEMPETYANNQPAAEEEEAEEPFPLPEPELEEREWKRRGSSTTHYSPRAEPETVVVKAPVGATVNAVKALSEQAEAEKSAMPALQPQKKLEIVGEINTVKSSLDQKEAEAKAVPAKETDWKKRQNSILVKEKAKDVLAPTYVPPVRTKGETTGVVQSVASKSTELTAAAVAMPQLEAKQARKPMEKLQQLRSQVELGNAEGAKFDKGEVVGIPAERKEDSKRFFEDNAAKVAKMEADRVAKIGTSSKHAVHAPTSSVVLAKKWNNTTKPLDAESAERVAKEQGYQVFMEAQLAAAKLKREQEENEERAAKVAARRLEIQRAAHEQATEAEKTAAEAAAAEAAAAAAAAAVEAEKQARLDASHANISKHSDHLDLHTASSFHGMAQGAGFTH